MTEEELARKRKAMMASTPAVLTAGNTLLNDSPGPRLGAKAFGAIEAHTPAVARDIVGKGINVVLSVDHSIAGMIKHKEAILEAGKMHDPLLVSKALVDAIGSGLHEHTTYPEAIPEHQTTAKILEAAAPGSFLIPFGPVAKELGRTASEARAAVSAAAEAKAAVNPGFARGMGVAREVSKLGNVVNLPRKIRMAAEDAGATKEKAAKFSDEVLNAQRRLEGERTLIDAQGVSDSAKELRTLLPTAAEQRPVTHALDIHPKEDMVGMEGYRDPKQWEAMHDALTPEQKKAYAIAYAMNNENEVTKLAKGVLSEETAAGFHMKEGGRIHVRRFLNEPKDAIKALDEAIAEKVAAGKDPKSLVEWKKDFESIPQSRFLRALGMNGRRIAKAGFLNERSTKALVDMGKSADVFNPDIAHILELERVETAHAVVVKDYLERILTSADNAGVLEKLDPKAIERGTHVKAKDFYHAFPEDKMIHKGMAEELFGVTQRATDTEGILKIAAAAYHNLLSSPFRRMALFLHPDFYIRNAIGSPVNAYTIGGIGPDAAPFYRDATMDVARWHAGKFKPGEKALRDEMIRRGVLNAGQSTERLHFLTKQHPNIAEKWLLPGSSNKPLAFMAEHFQGTIEDVNRLAAYRYYEKKFPSWSENQIMDNVMRAHFNYHGSLTKQERFIAKNILPFYRFQRFNIPAHIEMIAKHPERYAHLLRAIHAAEVATGGPQPDERSLPAWLAEEPHMRFGYDKKTGKYREELLQNVIPPAGISMLSSGGNVAREVINMMYPWLKAPIEAPGTFNVDLFRSTPDRLVRTTDGKQELFGHKVNPNVKYLSNMFPPLAWSNRIYEEGKQTGIGGAVTRALFGKSYEIDPSRSLKSYDHDIDVKINKLAKERDKEKNTGKRANLLNQINQLKAQKQDVHRQENERERKRQ